MTERTLARVVTIDELLPIEGADRIELAMVGGWQVVVQKGLYVPGVTKAVYFEVDSLLDTERPYFNSLSTLSSKLLHVVDGRTHARIKTMKLRKQLSQGFCIPLSETGLPLDIELGADLTKALGVVKYEKEAEKAMNNTGSAGGAKAGFKALGFPAFVPKTDQTRVQNITHMYNKAVAEGEEFEESFKLDGSSLTAFSRDGVAGVASRNVGFRVVSEKRGFFETLKDWLTQKRPLLKKEWKRVIPADDNAFVKMAHEAGLLEALKRDGRNIAIQGEMVGPSIQKNFEGVDKNEFFCYDVYLIDEQRYMLPAERIKFCTDNGVKHVPVNFTGPLQAKTVADVLVRADGPSGLKGKYREGFVYKSTKRDFSFKVISNTYLLKEE
ncbi:RNA ligase [Pseudomonas phage UNO-G1W1]|uniref:RNA ligase n=1 Tax=Pseudomonas phage UNO-G1W1 TaxID=3136609 RepID=A0AAX4MV30_9CAUD